MCLYIYIPIVCVRVRARNDFFPSLPNNNNNPLGKKKKKLFLFYVARKRDRLLLCVCVSCLFLFGVRLFENRRRVVPRLCLCSRSFVRFPKTKNNSVCFSILIPIHLDSSWSIGSCDGSRDDELRNQSQIVNLSLLVGNLGQI